MEKGDGELLWGSFLICRNPRPSFLICGQSAKLCGVGKGEAAASSLPTGDWLWAALVHSGDREGAEQR